LGKKLFVTGVAAAAVDVIELFTVQCTKNKIDK